MTNGEQGDPSAAGPGEAPMMVLHRCRMPTDYLCPCGAVARRLKRLGLQHRTVREAWSRSRRSAVEELTGQTRVPVLVRGDLALSDSKRILEYLAWLQAGGPSRTGR